MPPSRTRTTHHHAAVIVSHWLAAAIIALAVVIVLSREIVEDRAVRTLLMELHRSLGITILGLVLARLALRWPLGAHRVNARLPQPLRAGAAAGHGALYVLMLALPVTGWAMTGAENKTLVLFWTLELPNIVQRSRDLADTLQDWHETLAWTLVALAAAHAAAGLYHHFIRRDGVLTSMVPWLGGARRPPTG